MPEWKDTVNLPRTEFPMKANLPTAEPLALARWAEMDLYGKIRARRRGAPKFVLHDGPRTPTATSTWARRSTRS
jgi:isoleucyl-tRNA synthetase